MQLTLLCYSSSGLNNLYAYKNKISSLYKSQQVYKNIKRKIIITHNPITTDFWGIIVPQVRFLCKWATLKSTKFLSYHIEICILNFPLNISLHILNMLNNYM